MKILAPVAAFSFSILTISDGRSQNADHILKELVKPRPAVVDADNGWVEARKLTANFSRDEKGRKKDFITYPGEERPDQQPGVNEEVLKECLELNKATLATARKILQMPAWQPPRPEGRWPVALVDNYDARIFFPTRVILAEAMVEAHKGRLEKAWPDILAVMKLGRRIAESGGTVMDSMGGVQVLGNAARAAAWAGQQAPDAATARRLAADLEALEGYGDIYQRTIEGELCWIVKKGEFYQAGGEELKRSLVETYVTMDALRLAQKHFNKWGSSFKDHSLSPEKWPEIKWPDYPREENLAKWLKEPPPEVAKQIEEAKQTDWAEYTRLAVEQFKEARLTKPVTLAELQKSRRPERDTEKKEKEGLGFENSYELALNQVFRAVTIVRQARTSLLLRAWMYEHGGELPKTLDALVPEYLSVVPVDPFDGQPMRYRNDKLWSVGEDLKDDGGSGKDRVLPL